jgi:hypothetical protein
MADRECEECPLKELQKIHRLVQKRTLEILPEEVHEPLLEAKRQMRLVLRGLFEHVPGEKKACCKKHQAETRHIKFE